MGYVREGLKIFFKSQLRKVNGFKTYSGGWREICEEVVSRCYDSEKGFFRVSTGNFDVFYMRDFGWCCDSLLQLGFEDEVRSSLQFALRNYSENGRVATTIDSKERCFDFPSYSPDTLAFLLRSLVLLGDNSLVERFRSFLQGEIDYFYENVLGPFGLIRPDRHYSSIRDHSLRSSSCYNNCATAVVQRCAEELDFSLPERFDYEKLLVENFWEGSFFYDDINKEDYVSGDAQVFPFWFGVVDDEEKIGRAISSVRDEGLDSPFPLKYVSSEDVPLNMSFYDVLAPDYERHSIWAHIGLLWTEVVSEYDSSLAENYLSEYKDLVERHGTFLELYDYEGRPFRRTLYYTDAGLLWASNLLKLDGMINQ